MKLIAFDVGGSHIAGTLFDPNLRPLAMKSRHSVTVDCHGPESAFYEAVDQLVAAIAAEAKLPLSEIGAFSFAFPGPFDYEKGISRLEHKFESLKDKNLRDSLSARFRLLPANVQFVNDADGFLLGELSQKPSLVDGKVVGVTLGTGVGSAFAQNGSILRGGNGVPKGGEIWNLPWTGGIIEDAISTRAIQSAYQARTGIRPTVREIAESCPRDSDAVEVFRNFGRTLGEVLRTITSEFSPNAVIFGGAISRSANLFLSETRRELGGQVQVEVSTLFEDAALIGAAVHWQQVRR